MRLGIDSESGLAYEGQFNPEYLCVVPPSITQAILVETGDDWARLLDTPAHAPNSWVFREDTFDPVTRIRRGRLYQASSSQPEQVRRLPHAHENPLARDVVYDGRVARMMYAYLPCTALLRREGKGQGATIALGSALARSAWRIIQTEAMVTGDVMVTLKAMTAYGIVPELNLAAIDEAHRRPVEQALARVIDSAFRETPISVVDHCRNAATTLISRWLVQHGADQSVLSKDLGAVGKTIGDSPHDRFCVRNLADTIAKLHSRGKGNEQHTKQLRVPVDEDAEMALQAVGFILREIGWEKV